MSEREGGEERRRRTLEGGGGDGIMTRTNKNIRTSLGAFFFGLTKFNNLGVVFVSKPPFRLKFDSGWTLEPFAM